MTVQDLIELLEDMPDDAEVRLAYQPSWPLQYRVGDVVCPSVAPDLDVYETDGEWMISEPDERDVDGPYPSRDEAVTALLDKVAAEIEAGGPPVVYIAEAGQVSDAPYLPGHVSRELGWR